jgi:hypothetical protein
MQHSELGFSRNWRRMIDELTQIDEVFVISRAFLEFDVTPFGNRGLRSKRDHGVEYKTNACQTQTRHSENTAPR